MASQQRLQFLACGRCVVGGERPVPRRRRQRGCRFAAGVWLPSGRLLPRVRACPLSCPWLSPLPALPPSEFLRVWEAFGLWEAWSWLVWSAVAWLGW